MRIHVLSDLHLEFGAFVPPVTAADVVVLAGDIDIKGRAVDWARTTFSQPVVLVPGNHDYWGGSLGRTLAKMRTQAANSYVHVLQDEAVVIAGTRFLGCTLWTDYRLSGNLPLAQWDAQQTMRDFNRIRDERYRKITPRDLAERHARSRAFLERELAQPFAGKTVVVTHHAPCVLSLPEALRQASGHGNAAYASALDPLLGDPVRLWVHGHTHHSADYSLFGTRVVCNPRGYVGVEPNEAFDPVLVVEV